MRGDATRGQAVPARLAVAKPLYGQVRDILVQRIKRGEWAAGETLPNEFVLSSECGVSIGTIRRAIESLEEAGVVVRKQGRGTYVAGPGLNPLQDKFSHLATPLGQRLELGYEMLHLARRPCTIEEATALACTPATAGIEIEQRIETDRQPLGLERSIVLDAQFPQLETQLKFGQHLYPVFSDYGVLVTQAEETVAVSTADARIAVALGVAPGTTLLRITRVAVSLDELPVEYRVSHYIAEAVIYLNRIG